MTSETPKIADPKIFGAPQSSRPAGPAPAELLPIGLMAAAALIAVGQLGWFLVNMPPLPNAAARPFKPDPRLRLEVTLTPDELRAIAPEGLTWNELFQHYDLDDEHLAPTLRRNLGGDPSSRDLAAAADQPVPTTREIVLVLRE